MIVFEPCAFVDAVANNIAAKSVKALIFIYFLFSCENNGHWLQDDGLLIVADTKKERGAILSLVLQSIGFALPCNRNEQRRKPHVDVSILITTAQYLKYAQ